MFPGTKRVAWMAGYGVKRFLLHLNSPPCKRPHGLEIVVIIQFSPSKKSPALAAPMSLPPPATHPKMPSARESPRQA
jgi:hypothetical protein